MSERKPLIIFEENRPKVLHDLKDGRVDYIDLTHWDFMDKFFGFLVSTKFFEWCASTYPSPRKKEEIPLWFLIGCGIQMKLHVEKAFDNLPGILRSGTILSKVRFNVGLKGGGFNYKNKKERESPVHQDAVRKYFKDSDPDEMMKWYNKDVVGWYRRHRLFDNAGIFILDQTLLPLPDNANRKEASPLPLDEDGKYIDVGKLSEAERKKIKNTYCYSLTSLLHINRGADYFLYAGCHLGPGKESGLTEGEKLVDDFVGRFGNGVIKQLIADRGFLDGEMITRFKKGYDIDVLVPLRKDMDAFSEAIALTRDENWKLYNEEVSDDGKVTKRQEVAGIGEISIWETCRVPLYVAVMRTRTQEGINYWVLASTRNFKDPAKAFELYKKRDQIEERHKQLKGCWLIHAFTSTAFSLAVMQVVFVLLVYSLIQIYLNRKDLSKLANKNIASWRQEERLGKQAVVVYSRGYFTTLDLDEYTDIIISLEGAPRKRLAKWIKEFKQRKTRGP